jgi:proteasome alpha subunit
MSYNFYDFNNAISQRNEYVEGRLRDGSPVIGLSYPDGLLLLTLRTTQRKVFEIYDRIVMSALGRQSDIESIRLAANDQQAIPLTIRVLFGEVHAAPSDDQYFALGYDGEYRTTSGFSVVAGTTFAETTASESLKSASPTNLTEAISAALAAWGIARTRLSESPEKVDEDFDDNPLGESDPADAIRDALKDGWIVEAATLSRKPNRETRFRLLSEEELAENLTAYKS